MKLTVDARIVIKWLAAESMLRDQRGNSALRSPEGSKTTAVAGTTTLKSPLMFSIRKNQRVGSAIAVAESEIAFQFVSEGSVFGHYP